MIIRDWQKLPAKIKNSDVRRYYRALQGKKIGLGIKRVFDFVMSLILLVLFIIPMIVIGVLIITDSPGGIIFRQERVTQYGKIFMIHKFRTMTVPRDGEGNKVAASENQRITKIGRTLRKYRLDELPQLIDVLMGNMSFVGTRPEIPRYVKVYSGEMQATLLLKAGITSEASIRYKDEEDLMLKSENPELTYINEVLPAKMEYNLSEIRNWSIKHDVLVMLRTVAAVIKN